MNNKTARKNWTQEDTDAITTPWDIEEKKEADEAREMAKLQEEWIAREVKTKQETERKEEITKVKTSRAEEEKLEEKADIIKKLYALDYWMKCFNRVSFCNDVSGQALFHVVLGQALNNFKITLDDDSELDWRLHYLWIQGSGSGKGRALNFMNRVLSHERFLKNEYLAEDQPLVQRRYKINKMGRLNPSALLNTYEMNDNGTPKKDTNGQEIIKLGIIEQHDLIYSEEARSLLENKENSFELQEIIMTACETIGSTNNVYTKTLTDYKESCKTKCSASFAFTTRPFGKLKQTIIESGLIQRILFYPRELTDVERSEMNRLSSLAFKTANGKSSFSEELDRLITELNKVIDFAFTNKINFNESEVDNLLGFLYEKMKWFSDDIQKTFLGDEKNEIMQTFVSRYKNAMVILAFHSAAMRFSKYVEREDLQYAFDFVKTLYEAQKTWVGLTVEEDYGIKKERNELIVYIKKMCSDDKNEILTLSDLVNKASKKFRKDYHTMRYRIVKLSEGSDPLIKLVETANNSYRVKWMGE